MERIEVDQHVIDEFIEGSERAFSKLYQHYNHMLVGFGRHFFDSEATARDFAQEVWTAVWEGRAQFKRARNFHSYFWGLTWNRANERRRTTIRRGQLMQRYLIEKPLPVHNDVEHHFTDEDYDRLFDHALVANTERQKKIFRLSRIQGLSRTEIAQKLNLAQPTVDNDLSSAVKSVRLYWKSHVISLCLCAFSILLF
jgi:RNA polymerase sigma factor (sigma-70 family)